MSKPFMDEDLETMSREELIAEARRLRVRYQESLDRELPGAPVHDVETEPERRPISAGGAAA
jgi:hypothetical protein